MTAGLEVARAALAGQPAWLVGGAVRDRVLGRPLSDLDLAVDGDPEQAARAIARAAGRAACFALSEDFGAWRVVAHGGAWQADIERLRGGSLQADLRAARLHRKRDRRADRGGCADRSAGRAGGSDRRAVCGWPGQEAFADDPLRVLRLVRMAVELELEPEAQTSAAARAQTDQLRQSVGRAGVRRAAPDRSPRRAPGGGSSCWASWGRRRSCSPSWRQLRGIEQSRFHHLDVYGHTLEVLDRTIELQADPSSTLGGESRRGDPRAAGRAAGR